MSLRPCAPRTARLDARAAPVAVVLAIEREEAQRSSWPRWSACRPAPVAAMPFDEQECNQREGEREDREADENARDEHDVGCSLRHSGGFHDATVGVDGSGR